MNEYEKMYSALSEVLRSAETRADRIQKAEEFINEYDQAFLKKANKWASMNRKLVDEEARMEVSGSIDD